jgi:hypothetical protein
MHEGMPCKTSAREYGTEKSFAYDGEGGVELCGCLLWDLWTGGGEECVFGGD